ncbi:MAG: ATP-binding protein [Caldimonas sp.]
MRERPPIASARTRWGAACRRAATVAALLLTAIGPSLAEPAAPTVFMEKALVVAGSELTFPAVAPAAQVALPDRWTTSNPGYEGAVWYRTGFRFAGAVLPGELLALYIDRACSNVQILLNGQLIFSGGRAVEPVSRQCARPQLVTLPPALLHADGNIVDLRVQGHPLERVGSVRRAGGLSAVELGLQTDLASAHALRLFWEPAWIRGSSLLLIGLGCLMVAVGWLHRREVYFSYFGWLCLGWSALSLASGAADQPWSNAVTEFMLCSAWAVLLAGAVQFFLSFAGLRSRAIENLVALQWVALPLSLVVAGPDRLFAVANVWYALLGAELAGVIGIYLVVTRRQRPQDFVPMALVVAAGAAMFGVELLVQWGAIPAGPVSLAESLLPVLLVFAGSRLFLMFATALRNTEADRNRLAAQLQRMAEDMEARIEQVTRQRVEEQMVQRVEQFTELERKRIASDLHDDLGAKLLTIVHTSDSSRIPQLAREALEEMRLSVRGLAGKPVLLEEALADWRAEIITRLSQAGIKAVWSNPEQALSSALPARVFMQLTRILREAVNNVIKHSGARNCRIRCKIVGDSLQIRVRDDGSGFSGDLQRGQGMSTMKRRAKKIHGQCLVEARPGAGVVISLTAPL